MIRVSFVICFILQKVVMDMPCIYELMTLFKQISFSGIL